jgi:hypothetical protein
MSKQTKKKEIPEKTSDAARAAVISARATIIVALIGGAVTILVSFLLPRFFPSTPSVVGTPTGTIALTSTMIPSMTPTVISTITPPPAPNNISNCDTKLADRLFRYVLNQSQGLASALGVPRMIEGSSCVAATYQPFERGEMLWRSDTDMIYALFANGELKEFENTHKSGEGPSCTAEALSGNLLQPVWGFGKLWCEDPSIRERLGYGTIGERYSHYAIWRFDEGWLILVDYSVRAIFPQKGQWESIDVFASTQIALEASSAVDTKTSNLGLEQQRFIALPQEPLKVLDPLTGKPIRVPFEVGSKVSTQCADTSAYPDKIQIATNILQPVRVYLLLQAGWGVKSYEYRTIGKVSLKFDQGEVLETDLQLGYNIRDWADRAVAITTLNSPNAQAVWKGFEGEIPGKIDLLIVDIPKSYLSSTLKEIQIEDSSSTSTEGMDPCIHLSGITVSYLP